MYENWREFFQHISFVTFSVISLSKILYFQYKIKNLKLTQKGIKLCLMSVLGNFYSNILLKAITNSLKLCDSSFEN
jgi:hypothetical protein